MVEPAHVALPTWDRTLGDEVAAVCELANFGPDPEQKLGLDATFALDARGRSAAGEIAWLCCRQNLKTGGIKQTELGWLFVTDERLVVHTAHLFDTAKEAYRDLKEIIDGSSHLRKRIKRMADTPADMSIETTTGARLIFKTRTKGGGKGLSGRKIVLDEAFALQAVHMGALRPLISAQPDPQIVYASSACYPDSDVLRSVVKRGRGGQDGRLAFLEWCARAAAEACADGDSCTHVYGEAVGCGMDDVDELRRANPATGRRIALSTILDERHAAVTIDLAREFGRERMGWHDAPAGGAARITPDEWAAIADESSTVSATSTIALGLEVDPSGMATITAAGARADELVHGEITGTEDESGDVVLDHRPGTAWIVPRLVEIATNLGDQMCALVLDPSGAAGALIQRLIKAGFVKCSVGDDAPAEGWRLYLIGAREYAQACGAYVNDTREKTWRHLDQRPLNDAVRGAHTRDLADAFAWDHEDSTAVISPLVSLTLARHGFALFGEQLELEPWVL